MCTEALKHRHEHDGDDDPQHAPDGRGDPREFGQHPGVGLDLRPIQDVALDVQDRVEHGGDPQHDEDSLTPDDG